MDSCIDCGREECDSCSLIHHDDDCPTKAREEAEDAEETLGEAQ